MPTAAEHFKLPHEPFVPKSYSRRCPICGNRWRTTNLALRCWYRHPEEEGGGNTLLKMTLEQIGAVLRVSESTMERSWKHLREYEGAPKKIIARSWEPQDRYNRVVEFIKRYRSRNKGLPWGWSQRLADELHISRRRVAQIRIKALAKKDL